MGRRISVLTPVIAKDYLKAVKNLHLPSGVVTYGQKWFEDLLSSFLDEIQSVL